MELRHLRYFIAVAEELHFGKAAERLHISQQPLSRQIRDLEIELGVELFYRTKRTVRLTEVGQIFLSEARKTIQQAEKAVNIAQRANRGEIGRLTVGFTGSALNTMLPQIVRQFKQRHPEVNLSLERMQTNEQVEALHTGQIGAGLLHPPVDDNTLILETIWRENLVAVLPDIHPLAQESPRSISLKELADEPFILFPRHVGSVLYDRIISLCQEAGFSPNIVQEAIPQQTIVGLVSAGIGVTLLHASVQVMGRTGVVYRSILEATPELELAVAWHPDTTNPVLPAFIEVVREIAFSY